MTRANTRLRLGTRASALARWQAEWVATHLRTLGIEVELVPITTQGDVRTESLTTFGGVGAFTTELQRALLTEQIDVAVHSLKDLPTEQDPELVLAAVPVRERVDDVLISNKICRLTELAPGARIGTGSIRRRAQLLHVRPDLQMQDIRGNLDTRLRKLDEGRYDAIVLAEAGLTRLGLGWRIAERLGPPRMLPAIGQGALGIETRAADLATRHWVEHLDDVASHAEVVAERALLRRLRAGCLAPVAAWCRSDGDLLALDAVVLSEDGRERLSASAHGRAPEAEQLGAQVADQLRQAGAERLIQAAHRSPEKGAGSG